MIDRLFKPKDSRVYRWRFREKPEDGKVLDISLGTSELRVAEKRRTENRSKIHAKGVRDGSGHQAPNTEQLLAVLEAPSGDFNGPAHPPAPQPDLSAGRSKQRPGETTDRDAGDEGARSEVRGKSGRGR